MRTYNIFISHSWTYGDAYDKLVEMLDKAPRFSYRNYSVPKDDPVHNAPNVEVLSQAIRDRVRFCNVILIIAGVYSTYSKWINREIDIAKEFSTPKPIIAIEPWDSEKTSKIVKDNADKIVGWNTSPIVAAIRELSQKIMDDKEVLLEQYKMAVEMADRISGRREGANKFFLSANSIIFAFLATQATFYEIHVFISVVGILISLVWATMIQNYKNLNSAKYAVIHEMENTLPWKVYKDEWNKLKHGKDKKVYAKLTVVEKKLPWIFLVFYVFLFVYRVLCIVVF